MKICFADMGICSGGVGLSKGPLTLLRNHSNEELCGSCIDDLVYSVCRSFILKQLRLHDFRYDDLCWAIRLCLLSYATLAKFSGYQTSLECHVCMYVNLYIKACKHSIRYHVFPI